MKKVFFFLVLVVVFTSCVASGLIGKGGNKPPKYHASKAVFK